MWRSLSQGRTGEGSAGQPLGGAGRMGVESGEGMHGPPQGSQERPWPSAPLTPGPSCEGPEPSQAWAVEQDGHPAPGEVSTGHRGSPSCRARPLPCPVPAPPRAGPAPCPAQSPPLPLISSLRPCPPDAAGTCQVLVPGMGWRLLPSPARGPGPHTSLTLWESPVSVPHLAAARLTGPCVPGQSSPRPGSGQGAPGALTFRPLGSQPLHATSGPAAGPGPCKPQAAPPGGLGEPGWRLQVLNPMPRVPG